MKKNTVKQKLLAGKPSVGSWLNLASPAAAEHMAHLGWDWIVVDTEHSPADIFTATSMFQAICTTDAIPMARVAGNDTILIKKLLDAGALGIVVPMVNSADEAARAVQAMKFPPEGVRSAGGGRANLYGQDYQQSANNEIAVIMQLEHIKAVEAAQDILSIDGIDACFIGPSDLSKSMGCKIGSKEHEEAIQTILRVAKEKGVPSGIHCGSAKDVNMRIDQGCQFLALGSDVGFLTSAVRREREQLANVD